MRPHSIPKLMLSDKQVNVPDIGGVWVLGLEANLWLRVWLESAVCKNETYLFNGNDQVHYR
jgi:hypothetical protein